MSLKSSLVKILLGVTLGYLAGQYQEELNYYKNEVIRLCRKSLSIDTESVIGAKGSDAGAKLGKGTKKGKLFTKEDLWEKYRGGKGSKGLYLAIMGRVYDVQKGSKHYGPGGGYSFFAGRDGTKAFSTGEFNDAGLTDDLSGVETSHFGEYENWVKFFDKDYKYIGKLVGNFYDANGDPTPALNEAHTKMKEAQRLKDETDEYNKRFPQCNSEWSQAAGSRVWCSTKSGGVDRDWVGVPRLLKPAAGHRATCVCIRNKGPTTLGHTSKNADRGDLDYPYLKEYEGCDPDSISCKVKRK